MFLTLNAITFLIVLIKTRCTFPPFLKLVAENVFKKDSKIMMPLFSGLLEEESGD